MASTRSTQRRSKPSIRRDRPAAALGVTAAVGAAFSYGVTVAVNRSLARSGASPDTVLGLRFAVASTCLFLVLAARRRPLLPRRGERGRVVLLGAAGYGFQATLFYMALERGTTAAVGLLFYTYPPLVVLLELTLGWAPLDRRRPVAVGLSALGSVLVVASGGSVTITPTGVALALGAALSFGLYLLTSDRVVRFTDAMTTGAWVAGGAAASTSTVALLRGGFDVRGEQVADLVALGVATAAAFSLMFVALRRLGAGPTAVVMTLEAVFAVILAALFLDEAMGPSQLAGGACILAAAVLIGGAGPTRRVLRPPRHRFW